MAPKEVEEVIYGVPGVAEVVVVGVQDPLLGEAIKAVVVPRLGWQLTEQGVLRHCTQHLEDFMIPKIIEFRESLPRTENGKVDRGALKQSCGPSEA